MGFVLAHAALLAAFAAVLWMAGSALDRLSGGRLPLPQPRSAGRVLLGVLAATAALFGLAAAGALARRSVLALAVVASVGWVLSLRRPATREGGAGAGRNEPLRWGALAWAVASVVGVLFAALFLEALNPYPAWDAQVYHLTLPKIWLAASCW